MMNESIDFYVFEVARLEDALIIVMYEKSILRTKIQEIQERNSN